ncbi:hypothetical protein [Microvirga makkahensis]|uniref:Anti-sigma factor n=1 Tax=Microvirga makkahensis TaxID=1128670 RepID=A0A7X3SR86_9HYPH|nr:hypothetical protein [Microvirga makkahensis]MXQ14105.1 hypothetical protein [Microvirga makkahensis]
MNPHGPHQALWMELNALADGELESDRLAEAAARIADDPDAARAFAAVAALKAATAKTKSPPKALPLPASPGSARRSAAVAAAVILGVGLGTVLSLPQQQPPPPHGLLAPASLGLPDDVTVGGLRLPNLETSNLRLERVITSDGPPPSLRASYVGERGCRLSLTIMRSDDAESLPEYGLAEQVASWRAGPYLYTMTSTTRMDLHRFASVVQIAQAATLPAGSTLVADAADLMNRPCLG